MMREATSTLSQPRPSESSQAHRTSNAFFLKIAGGPLWAYSRLTHIAHPYRAHQWAGIRHAALGLPPWRWLFVMALLYGEAATVDWCRNVMAPGGCTLKTRGHVYESVRPEIVSAGIGLAIYPPLIRRIYRSRGIREFLWVHRK